MHEIPPDGTAAESRSHAAGRTAWRGPGSRSRRRCDCGFTLVRLRLYTGAMWKAPPGPARGANAWGLGGRALWSWVCRRGDGRWPRRAIASLRLEREDLVVACDDDSALDGDRRGEPAHAGKRVGAAAEHHGPSRGIPCMELVRSFGPGRPHDRLAALGAGGGDDG